MSYGPRFSPSIYGLNEKRTDHKSKGKNKDPKFAARRDRENEDSKIFIISLYLGIERTGREVLPI